jgi:purine-cytosine permease-like protein
VFNRGQQGGPYWFRAGWNIPGITAWLLSATFALLTVNMPGHYVGWLGHVAGDLDVSLIAALGVPALIYPALLYLFPEPRAVFGPKGPRGVPSIDSYVSPIVARIPRRAAP